MAAMPSASCLAKTPLFGLEFRHWRSVFIGLLSTVYLKHSVLHRCPECKFGDLDQATSGDGRWNIEWYAVPCNVGSSTLVYSIVVSSYYWFSLVVSNTRQAALSPSSLLPPLSPAPSQNTQKYTTLTFHAQFAYVGLADWVIRSL